MTTLLSRAALAAAAMALGLSSAYATTTASGTLNVSFTVQPNCSVEGGSIVFPIATVSSGKLDGSGSISINCTTGTKYNIQLSDGDHYSGGRHMVSGGASIPYTLYTDSGHLTEWKGPTSVPGTGIGYDEVPVYGHTDFTNASPGTYTDSVVVYVTY